MSDTNQDDRLRLVPLMFTASGTPRSGYDIDLVLSRAARGMARLYIPIPPTDVAYADPDFSGGQQPSAVEMRTFTANISQLAEYMNTPHVGVVHDSLVVTHRGRAHPEATYLALGSWHAEELRTKRHATLDIFPASLEPHPNVRLAQQGWLVPCRIPSALRLCSRRKATNGAVTSNLGSRETLHGELSDSPAVVSLRDILIDALVEDEITVKLGEPQDDPYGLRDGAYGVYLLYRAADNFYDLWVNGQVQREEVERWVSSHEPTLYQKTVTHHAVKLISPRHRRGSGGGKSDHGDVKPEVFAPEIFRPGHQRPAYVTDGLALLIAVALWWVDECNKVAEKLRAGERGAALPGYDDVDKQLERAGFKTKETPFLRRVVRWSPPSTSA